MSPRRRDNRGNEKKCVSWDDRLKTNPQEPRECGTAPRARMATKVEGLVLSVYHRIPAVMHARRDSVNGSAEVRDEGREEAVNQNEPRTP